MRRGESMPCERHGEQGVLYRPFTDLTESELCLYGRAFQRCVEADLPDTRDNALKILREEAEATIADSAARAAMLKHVIAFMDEMAIAVGLAERAMKQ
jgi:hypothetical protein